MHCLAARPNSRHSPHTSVHARSPVDRLTQAPTPSISRRGLVSLRRTSAYATANGTGPRHTRSPGFTSAGTSEAPTSHARSHDCRQSLLVRRSTASYTTAVGSANVVSSANLGISARLRMTPSDLTVDVFLAIRDHFFGARATPKPFSLRDKRNTQDDPLDEHIVAILTATLPGDITVATPSGPLISPDLTVFRRALCDNVPRAALRTDLSRIVGLEVKKLERAKSGKVARPSGLDYNTTPPCGTVRVYDRHAAELQIRGFYLFVCLEPTQKQRTYGMTALALCDGNLLNDDFPYYASIVGRRTKEVGLGTYGDGANRLRPMTIFANPLGAGFLDGEVTLIHAQPEIANVHRDLVQVGSIVRSVPGEANPGTRCFYCYRHSADVIGLAPPFQARDPFTIPKRGTNTAPRGRFLVDVVPSA